MVSIQGLTFAWTAVYAYLAVYCGLLFKLRGERAHGTFALTCGCLSLFALGCGMSELGSDVAHAAFWQTVQVLGVVPAGAFFVDFVHSFLGARRGPLVFGTYAWGIVGWIAALAGLFIDPAFPEKGVIRPGGLRFYEARLTPIGTFFVVGTIAWLASVLVVLARGARHRKDARVVLIACGFFVASGVHDMIVQIFGIPTLYLAEHAGMVANALVAWILVDRVTQTSDALANRTRDLEQSHDALKAAQTELHRSDQLALVGELSAVIAHEVRAPLSVIKSAALELRRPEIAEAPHANLLDVLDEESNRLNRLVTDLLLYARPLAPQGRPIALAELVADAGAQVRRDSGRGEGILTRVGIPEDVRVQGDPDLLRRAFSHVIENAFQAMAAGGVLSIESAPGDADGAPAVTVAFRDTGEGMDTLVRRRAGVPFFTTRPSGTGLGLAIVDRLVRVHGGAMQIDSRHGSGTTVSITLPIEPPAPAS